MQQLNFDEWYAKTYNVEPDDILADTEAYYQYFVARRAWEASRKNLRVDDI